MLPAPDGTAAASPVFADAALEQEEIPLGWECANPALQIERWEGAGSSAAPAGCGSTS